MVARQSIGVAIAWLAAVATAQAQYGQAPPSSPYAPPQPYAQQAPGEGQQPPYAGAPAPAGPAEVNPQLPTIQPRTAPPQRPAALPFILTAQQQQEVDQVLQAWEQQSGKIKRFECDFNRFEYSRVFAETAKKDPNQPVHMDQGKIMYEWPDKGRFEVLRELVDGKPIEGQRAERWITDGRSIFEYDFTKRQLTEHRLPPELQGKMSEGPLPFLFGAKAETLKRRYFIRLVTPPNVQGQVWLEAWPAFAGADFQRAEVILTLPAMQPYALQLHQPNHDRTVYQFTGVKINSRPLLQLLGSDPFLPTTPLGWKKVVEEPSAPQVGAGPQPAAR